MKTIRIQNPDTPRAGGEGLALAVRGGPRPREMKLIVGRSGTIQDEAGRCRAQQKYGRAREARTTFHLDLQGAEDNCPVSSKAWAY